MKKNIKEMTINEIEDYIVVINKNNELLANMISKHRDFMASVEKFEDELDHWHKHYADQHKEALDKFIQADDDYMQELVNYHYTSAAVVAVETIKEKFESMIDWPNA